MKTFKTWLLAALILITLLLLTYLGIAFVYLNFNPYDWNQGQRELLVFMGFLFVFSISSYVVIVEN
jgi:hypothetical protein